MCKDQTGQKKVLIKLSALHTTWPCSSLTGKIHPPSLQSSIPSSRHFSFCWFPSSPEVLHFSFVPVFFSDLRCFSINFLPKMFTLRNVLHIGCWASLSTLCLRGTEWCLCYTVSVCSLRKVPGHRCWRDTGKLVACWQSTAVCPALGCLVPAETDDLKALEGHSKSHSTWPFFLTSLGLIC